MESQPFDLAGLSRRIERKRTECGLSMAELAREVGVAASTIRRFSTADDAEADGVLALVGWLGEPPECFMVEFSVPGRPLPQAGAGVIRVDMERVVGPSPGRRTGSRTTIQRLAAAANTSGQPVASLTRWSEV